MSENKKMKTALVSVFHKDGLEEIITTLHKEGVQLLSTGGTQEFIELQPARHCMAYPQLTHSALCFSTSVARVSISCM